MNKVMNLYALPYAGGHSLVYRHLEPLLKPAVTLKTLDPSGHGRRSREPLITDMEKMADDIFEQIKDELADHPYAVFGHSMGALLAYLLTRRIDAARLPSPGHLFCSGRGAPSVLAAELLTPPPRHTLPSADFWAYIDGLGGVPPELKAHRELMDYFEPVLRADIKALECYQYRPPERPLALPITVFYGLNDKEINTTSLLPWHQESQQGVTFCPLHGGHFGILEQLPMLARRLLRNLS
ncbi:Thioesterase domain-containing protein [Gammaproteobacteria bacterium]